MDDILVPTDFSTCADHAAEFAMQLAAKISGEVTFIHLIGLDNDKLKSDKDHFYSDVSSSVAKINSKLNVYVDEAQIRKIKALKAIHYEKNYKSLVAYILENDTYMVIMGSRGHSAAKDLLMGSSALKVLRHSPVPVVVVNGDYPNQDFNTILLISDFEEVPALGFRKIVAIARRWKMEVHFLYVNTVRHFRTSRDIFARMNEYSKGAKDVCKHQYICNAFSVEEGVKDYCERHPGVIASMVSHYHRGASGYIHGSITEKLIHYLSVPMLSVHD